MGRGSLASQSCPFGIIAGAIRTQVANALLVNPQNVRVVASDAYKITEDEDLFVFIRFYQPRPRQDGGAGRLCRIVSRRFRCYLYTRSGADVYGGDEFALMGSATVPPPDIPPVPPQFQAEEALYDALDDFRPLYQNTGLCPEPLHALDDNGPPERKPENEEGLVRSALDFEVVYVLSINPVEPAPQSTTVTP